MATYDERKQKYEAFNDKQKQQWNNVVSKMDESKEARQFTERYNKEQQGYQAQPEQQQQPIQQTANGDTTQQPLGQTVTQTPEDIQKSIDEAQKKIQNQNYDPNEQLDTSMFGASDGKVKVQEGTAQQTGMPDYQLDSDARTKEITDNLNAYWQTNREYFSDRNTYNQMFHYNERSDQQKAVLDSYWKKKEDIDKATKYSTGDSISHGMKDAEITPDQLNYIKDYSPEAYREWQQKQIDEINLRIANLATPADPTSNAELFTSLMEKLNLEPGDPYQIYDNWYNMAERLGVFSDSEKLKSYQDQLDQNHAKIESIMNRYSASTGGTVSDALAAARMQKALAPYQQREVDLQNSYTSLLNGRNSNLAVANQSATALAMQAQEDQRIFNQRLQGLGFAMTTASYRSPEQQAQLQLQTAQIQNDMNLLQTSMSNDLARYNTYATYKLQNQLQNELTDLSVEDENQLKANLNNALSDYYNNYGDIIQRSQAQAVEDIIKYAKKNGISVAQAMTENFIKPLQNKKEYKQKIATDYGMLMQQSIGTINGRSVIMTTNPNGSISYQFIDDPTSTEVSTTAKPYDLVDEKVLSNAPINYGYNTLGTFMLDRLPTYNGKGGQCGKFVNDYLEYIGMERYYDDELSTKLNSVNSDTPKEGTIAVFDYGHKSSDGINHGHVGIVTKVNKDGSFEVTDSNYDVNNPGKIQTRTIRPGSSSLKGFFDPSQPPRVTSTESVEDEGVEIPQGEYNPTRIGVYEAYIYNGTAPTDAKLKSIGGGDLETGWKIFDSEVQAYMDATGVGSVTKRANDEITSLRKEFNSKPIVQDYNDMKNSYEKLVASNDGTAAGDLSLIFSYMKMLDPGSVVREGEFANAENAGGIPDKVRNLYNKAVNGTRLSKKQRENFIKVAENILDRYTRGYNQLLEQYKSYAVLGGDVNNIGQVGGMIQSTTTGPTEDATKYRDGYQNIIPQNNSGSMTADMMNAKVDLLYNLYKENEG